MQVTTSCEPAADAPGDALSARYDLRMTDARLRASLRAAGRALRWKPRTYEQAWLFAVVGAASFLIGSIVAAALDNWPRPWPLVTFVSALVGFLGQGLGSSYDLYRRRQR
jgi:hypothetical protein